MADARDLICPVCGRAVDRGVSTCAGCGTPLDSYLRVAERALRFHERAVALADEQRTHAAARAAQGAVAIAPDKFEFQLLLARLLAEVGETEEAIACAEAAFDLRADPEAETLLQTLYSIKYAATPVKADDTPPGTQAAAGAPREVSDSPAGGVHVSGQ